MPQVNTVLGPRDVKSLGPTLSHEHLLVASAGIQQVYPEFIDRDFILETVSQQLMEAYQAGLRTVVEVTTIDLGRDIRLMEEASRRSGVNVVACTGTWLDIPRVFWAAKPDQIADLYVREIEVGIEGTGIKAGVIKVATDIEGVTPQNDIILRAAARASRRTGVRISTHTNSREKTGIPQVKVFEEEGVDMGAICVGHSNDTTDTDYLVGLLKKGVYLGMDHFPGGRPGTPTWEERTQVLKKLIDAGHEDKIMVSHDHSPSRTVATRPHWEERRKANPDGYAFILRNVLPRLKQLGVPEKTVDKLMVDNPRRFFGG